MVDTNELSQLTTIMNPRVCMTLENVLQSSNTTVLGRDINSSRYDGQD